MRTQLNVRVSKGITKHVRDDKRLSGKTNDIIVEVALEAFFTKWTPEERLAFYRAHDRTPYARAA